MPTPNAVIEYMKSLVKNKVFCELCCGKSPVARGLKDYASDVFGIDRVVKRQTRYATRHGVLVIVQNLLDKSIPIPEADVYYIWLYSYNMVRIAMEVRSQHSASKIIVGMFEREARKCAKCRQLFSHFEPPIPYKQKELRVPKGLFWLGYMK
jgi:hypothetical protein